METTWEPTQERLTLHGLGFIQVILDGKQRMHIWHPSLPRRRCYASSSIHDHRFGFSSRILIGRLRNRVYNVWAAPNHLAATHLSYLHDGPRMPTGNRGWKLDAYVIRQMSYEQEIAAGFEYFMQPYVFHESTALDNGIAVTIMTKTIECQFGARSLCVNGVAPDVDFDRKQWPQDRLAGLVASVLMGNSVQASNVS